MLNIIVSEAFKGWFSPKGIPVISSELYSFLGFPSTYVRKKEEIFFYSFHLMNILSGRVTAAQGINLVLARNYQTLQGHPMINSLGKDVIVRAFMDNLSDSFDSLKKPGKPLGLIAEQLVMLITGREDMIVDACELISAIPVLQIHGQVEETYLAAKKGRYDWFEKQIRED